MGERKEREYGRRVEVEGAQGQRLAVMKALEKEGGEQVTASEPERGGG
ncbi:MAG: hypothetical protein HLX50_02400 [Alteromonadaceae bacterium]|nr:hypothetical protein [Alteromonadaceae bacterium]